MPSITFDEWKLSQQAKQLEKKSDKVFQQQAVIAVSKKAETVVNHEGWQTFLDHLGALKDEANRRNETLIKALAYDNEISSTELGKLKLQISHIAGEIKSLDMAITLIPTLISAGKPVATDKGAKSAADSTGAQDTFR